MEGGELCLPVAHCLAGQWDHVQHWKTRVPAPGQGALGQHLRRAHDIQPPAGGNTAPLRE